MFYTWFWLSFIEDILKWSLQILRQSLTISKHELCLFTAMYDLSRTLVQFLTRDMCCCWVFNRSSFLCIITLLQRKYTMQYVFLLLHMSGWLDLATSPIITSGKILALQGFLRWHYLFWSYCHFTIIFILWLYNNTCALNLYCPFYVDDVAAKFLRGVLLYRS